MAHREGSYKICWCRCPLGLTGATELWQLPCGEHGMGQEMCRPFLPLMTMAEVTRAGTGCGPDNSLPFMSFMEWEDGTCIPVEGDEELWGAGLALHSTPVPYFIVGKLRLQSGRNESGCGLLCLSHMAWVQTPALPFVEQARGGHCRVEP